MATSPFRISGQRVLIGEHASPPDLPPGARALLEHARFFFGTPAWWRATIAAALPDGAEPCFLSVTLGDRTAAVFPMLRTGGAWQGLTTLYTYRYAPQVAAVLTEAERLVVFTAFGRWLRARGVTRLDCLDPADPHDAPLQAGLRAAGLVPLPFAHFGIWEEAVAGCDWPAYLARRDGRLRETIRRRLRDVHAMPDARFDVLTSAAEIAAATDAYDRVAAQSWKQAEPFPAFNRVLFREAAADGALFMTMLTLGETPVAVQAWAVWDRRATVLKLVHDEALGKLSPGTVLTALSIRHLLRDGAIDWLDFGRGDDPYKKSWVRDRRQRGGLLVANPWRPAGLAAVLRHAAGQVRRRFVKGPPALPSAPSPP